MMKNKVYIIVSICLLFLYAGNTKAQDIHFSQFYENNTLRNPGLVGIMTGDYKAGVIYRSQWSSVSVPYTTALASYETRVLVNKDVHDYVSFGLTFLNYKAGKVGFKTSSVYGAVNYNKSLEDGNKTYLSVGFTGAYFQRAFDINKMTFASQYVGGAFSADNPTNESFRTSSLTGYDVGAGISLNGTIRRLKNSSYYIGGAAYNIVRPSESYIMNSAYLRRSVRYTGSLGFQTSISEMTGIALYANYQNQAPYHELVFGGLFSLKDRIKDKQNTWVLSLGCFYRVDDALIPTIKVEYQNWALNFSYDNAKSGRLGNLNFGSYELSLFVRGFYKHKREYNDLKCPSFGEIMLGPEN